MTFPLTTTLNSSLVVELVSTDEAVPTPGFTFVILVGGSQVQLGDGSPIQLSIDP